MKIPLFVFLGVVLVALVLGFTWRAGYLAAEKAAPRYLTECSRCLSREVLRDFWLSTQSPSSQVIPGDDAGVDQEENSQPGKQVSQDNEQG